ncbi:hypothetical protein P168DRAFT_309856 [Aspergillus campestris IBT 28561]|uniref:Fatty acyl-CoA reductase n=1 Tax=Aspergillus campestris (strain IBT 28561) TaxID=1392248 RepID=A0A2I1D6S6_ASPC2|nr:uncharacterized protein P168DRAFT_309856 [Aspergillus campestris IBT 28561]PKY05567.1 hypothetical protein P168DRAFT_309856 [Aspergillus campestris IBT 28561]
MSDNVDWYRNQVIFLTGGTGNLGACLLYKLSLQLPTKKIFILCRGSVRRAVEKLETAMPEYLDLILDTRKVQFISPDLQRLRDEVTVVLDSVGDISLQRSLPASIQVNCVAHLALMDLCRSFSHLQTFLHLSATSRLYPVRDNEPEPNAQLSTIQETGGSDLEDAFPAPYALAKHIAERVILSQADWPFLVLIVRPSLFSPALRDPYPLYGSNESILIKALGMSMGSHWSPSRLLQELGEQTILDEIPVDLVVNTCLAHLAAGSGGIVHAAANLYMPRKLGDVTIQCHRHLPADLTEMVSRGGDATGAAHLGPVFFRMLLQHARDWRIECPRSQHLQRISDPALGLNLEGHDFEAFMQQRCELMAKIIARRLNQARQSISLS